MSTVVQRHHRSVVAPPSIHPEGRSYPWAHPEQDELGCAVAGEAPHPDELPDLPAAWLAALATRPTTSARGGTPRRARPVGAARRDALKVLARPGNHHQDWITAKLDDELRGLCGRATDEAAAVAGFLTAQAHHLGVADVGLDRLAAALARHPDRPELVAAARASHARARTARWTVS